MTPEIKNRIDQIRRGEVPAGYRRTKAGILPDSWEETKLKSLSENITKGATPTTYGFQWVSEGILFLKSDCVSDNGFILQPPIYISNEAHETMKRSMVCGGDILISITGYLGKVGVIPPNITEANINQHIARIRVLQKECVPLYIYYYLRQDFLQKRFQVIQTGQAYPQLSLEQIRDIEVELPPMKEQQKIAEILTAQDKIIELKEDLLTEKQRQKKYLMQQLLTGKKRLPGFDGEWKMERLGRLFSERKEVNFEGLEMLAITGTQGIIPRKELDLKDNSSEDKSKYLRICSGDIGYNTMRMWQGVSAYSDYEGIVSPAYTVLKPRSTINAKYFAYLFKIPEIIFLFYRFSQGLVDDTRNLKYENFRRITVLYPPEKKEQTAIAQVLSTADQELDLLRQAIEQEKQKKKALMQLLLTGIVRVNV